MMARAIALGHTALGKAWPNPAVGCVLLLGDQVIGEGATGAGGRPHAEEQAIAGAGDNTDGATAYVTLEPCAVRSSGAPSCSERLIAAGVARVVVACEDPTPKAGGAGLARLQSAGIKVDVGLLQAEAAVLSAGFAHRVLTGRPLVEASESGAGYDGAFEPAPGEDIGLALLRYGREGYNRLWTPIGGPDALRLKAAGLLHEP